MVLKYKISLPGIKGFARVYEVKDNTSLYHFHKQMRADMDFPQDQMILFKAVDQFGGALARYSVVDLGCGTIDEVTLGQLHQEGQDSFVYFYDTTNKKSVLMDFVEECLLDKTAVYPNLVETKGPNPIEFENGYVAFEDRPVEKRRLPDDDDEDFDEDEDEEEEDEDDDETEEVYDEDEE
ncbi:MAG: hypothetical protein MJY67_04025 [Bacteroidales bacterium]|nr:hypothetical protein [Bacteroidales bacterium]